MNLNALKNFVARNYSVEDLVAVRADLKTLAANFDDMSVAIPEWLTDKLTEVESEVKTQTKADKMAALKKLRSQEAALMTRDERREAIKNQIAELEASI